jgi:uncharacterized protein (TIGR00297 family)
MPILPAVALAALIAGIARWLRALSAGGAAAATGVGAAVLWAAGWPGGLVLGVYFVTSTGLSRIATGLEARSDQAATETRTARQVLANGGLAAVGALAEFRHPGQGLWLLTVSLAASGGDTWATALGSLSPRPPRDLLRRHPVAPGTSGGVTWFGTSGSLMGAAIIGLTGMLAGGRPELFLAAALIGFGATLLDSVLGSAAQARFYCPRCDEPTERRLHRCGTVTTRLGGVAWLDNDAVNAASSLVALLAGLAWWSFAAG